MNELENELISLAKKFKIEDCFFFSNLSLQSFGIYALSVAFRFPLLSLKRENLCKTSKAFSTSIVVGVNTS